MTSAVTRAPLAIVGAGFSGTMAALHLLPRLGRRAILLCERGERFGRGLAYGTDDAWHLLNVRASNMSAFPDRPHHFIEWLEARAESLAGQIHVSHAGTFVSRRLYGDYLTQLLNAAVSGPDGAARLILVPDEVVDLVPQDGGYDLILAGGVKHRTQGAVLALGNPRPAVSETDLYVTDPWSVPFTEGLRPGEPVAVIGSGLTMVDVALHLRHAGFQGPVIALSRRGLSPRSHTAALPWTVSELTQRERLSPVRLLQRLRLEVAEAAERGVPWQSVVDSLRPITSELWRGFSAAQQSSFIRHARPWWDIHRHRMAPPVAEAFEAMTRSGFLTVHPGHIEQITFEENAAKISVRPRGTRQPISLIAQRVINASGNAAPDRCGIPLIMRLIERGLARVDRHRLGLDLSDDLALIGTDGSRTPKLWALGPLGTGSFWECVAVPDIRRQALRLAAEIEARL